MPEFPPQTRPYLKMAIPCFLELEEVAAKSFSVLWGGKGLRKCVSSGAGAFHSSAPAHISYTSFINERPLPGLSTKCCFWGSKWPVHYSCTKMCFFTQTFHSNGHFQLCLCYRNFINERQFPGLSPKCRFWSSKWPALYICIESVFLLQTLSTNGQFQNVASGAPHGQFSTFELKCGFFLYKLYQRTATSRTVSKMWSFGSFPAAENVFIRHHVKMATQA